MFLSADEEIKRRYETTESCPHNFTKRSHRSWSHHKSKLIWKEFFRNIHGALLSLVSQITSLGLWTNYGNYWSDYCIDLAQVFLNLAKDEIFCVQFNNHSGLLIESGQENNVVQKETLSLWQVKSSGFRQSKMPYFPNFGSKKSWLHFTSSTKITPGQQNTPRLIYFSWNIFTSSTKQILFPQCPQTFGQRNTKQNI
jgi:hypothetical protein